MRHALATLAAAALFLAAQPALAQSMGQGTAQGRGQGHGMGGQPGAQAQAPPAQAIQDEYKAMDRNKDGRVDFKEFQRRYPDMVRMEFRLIDADGSKWISIQEWESFRTAHGAMQPGEAE